MHFGFRLWGSGQVEGFGFPKTLKPEQCSQAEKSGDVNKGSE